MSDPEHPDQGRFPGAGGAYDGEYLTSLHIKGDAVEYFSFTAGVRKNDRNVST